MCLRGRSSNSELLTFADHAKITHSENYAWLNHLTGARDLILYRGGPKTNDYLTRFFSLLDVSGSLSTGTAPLLEGNYWIDQEPQKVFSAPETKPWPYYDSSNYVIARYHELMTYMVRLSKVSADSMSEWGMNYPDVIRDNILCLRHDLRSWWDTCEEPLRDQKTNWRQLPRPRKLTVSETLEAESISSAKSVMMGCVIYLEHLLDPLGDLVHNDAVAEALDFILETAKETPEGFGLEMGLHWGLFMAGTVLVNDFAAEELIRHKLKADNSISIYVRICPRLT